MGTELIEKLYSLQNVIKKYSDPIFVPMLLIETFNENNFIEYCNILAAKDAALKAVIQQYGYPPLFSRTPSFATLIHFILEQQVSLASAKAAFLKLESLVGHIVPEKILLMTDEEMKACYFSRQKMQYARHLAMSLINREWSIEQLTHLPDSEIRAILKKIKGIGDWTVDVFLMIALHRCDCFPTADVALMKSAKEVKGLPFHVSKEEVLQVADQWKPYRTIAAYILWHNYIKKRNIRF